MITRHDVGNESQSSGVGSCADSEGSHSPGPGQGPGFRRQESMEAADNDFISRWAITLYFIIKPSKKLDENLLIYSRLLVGSEAKTRK